MFLGKFPLNIFHCSIYKAEKNVLEKMKYSKKTLLLKLLTRDIKIPQI